MVIDNNLIREIVDIAYDEIYSIYKVDLKKDIPNDFCLDAKLTIALAQAMTGSALICYHRRLEALLKQKGIDISSLDTDG